MLTVAVSLTVMMRPERSSAPFIRLVIGILSLTIAAMWSMKMLWLKLLAAANALKTDKNAITFNPAAITSATKQGLGLPSGTQKGSILNVVVKGEIVDHMQSSMGLKADGRRYELQASYFPIKNKVNTVLRIKNHSIDTVIQKLK